MQHRFAIAFILTATFIGDLIAGVPQKQESVAGNNQYFEMHSGFWLNLHHFLYLQAVLAAPDVRKNASTALEILFHESSHAMLDSVEEALSNQCKLRAVTLNQPTLRHAILFYTTGIPVREQLPGYTPLADSIGPWRRAWPMYIGPLQTDWQPYLDGKTPLTSAVASLVKRVGQPVSRVK